MNYFTKNQLESATKGLGNFTELSLNNESSLIISEYGGRILGLFPRNEEKNLLWINPNMENVIRSKSWELGGDRYWISPEREYFYENPQNWEGWFCPSGLDPAYYEILGESSSSCTLSSPLNIESKTMKLLHNGEITRQFRLIKEPIKTDLSYIGIEILDDCIFFRPGLKMNGWSLSCVISGGLKNPGTVLIPTKSAATPISYFRKIPEERIRVLDDHVAFKIDVNDIYKLGVRPEDIDFSKSAKIGYVLHLPGSEDYGFVLKISDDIPRTQGECFDVARDNPNGDIGIIQSYNSESSSRDLLSFGELELQLNSFKTIDNTSHGKAKHQILSYLGSKTEIYSVIQQYLGISEPFLF